MMSALSRFHVAAALLLSAILLAAALYWPLPTLGVSVDPATGKVLAVAAGSPGERAGVRVGDLIVQFYGHPWESFNSRPLVVPLPWREGTPSPMTVRRDNELLSLVLQAHRPDFALQVDKLLRTFVALVCWATGVALGTSRQRNDRRLQWAAWFWMLLGAALGVYQLAQAVSYVLTVGILWVLLTLLAPTAVMMHLWYPSRPTSPTLLARARRWWLIAISFLQLAVLCLAAYSGATTGLLKWLDSCTTLVFLACFLLSGFILWRAYRVTTIAHIQRQIRLIATACVIVACVWVVLLLGEILTPELIVAIPPVTLTVFAALVPLAYLLGGISIDLLRVDVLARQIRTHACTVVGIMVLLVVAAQLELLTPTPMLVTVLVLAAYQPAFQVVRWLETVLGAGDQSQDGLSKATMQLGSTLEARQLAEIMSDSLTATFRKPPVALYIKRASEADELELATQCRLELPPIITSTLIDQVFRHEESLLPIGLVQQRISQKILDDQGMALVFAPLVNLWGIIRHAKGATLGLVVLGPRGDLDPYREHDFRELNQLLTAAALAFTNSANYEQQVQAQKLIRRLYRHLQQAQEQTASAIARELHDEVLNVNVRLNILSLEGLVAQASVLAPELSDELQTLLESEQSTGTLLRLICEQLRPAYSDDPLGLVASLRRVVERLSTTWNGHIHINVELSPVPVSRHIHRELIMIAREAVTNAIKHAGATEIIVTLRFPAEGNQQLLLSIRDNGPARQKIERKAGHLGLHFMQESADAIGAKLNWLLHETGGIEVCVVVPIASREDASLLTAVSPWWEDLAHTGDKSVSATLTTPENLPGFRGKKGVDE
ncbi:MAG: hypothetical protein OHK0015_35890 [Chloroflexi bacterium OHK40]